MADDQHTKKFDAKAWHKAYEAANREKIRAYKAAYRAANRERIEAHRKEYYAAHKEEAKAYQHAYYAANREESLLQHAEYRARNRERIRARSKAYVAAKWADKGQRLVYLARLAKYRAKKRGLKFDGLPKLTKAKPPKACGCCGKVLDYSMKNREASPSLDRLEPAKGYTDENTRVICFGCNAAKGTSSLAELKVLVAYMERNLRRPVQSPPSSLPLFAMGT